MKNLLFVLPFMLLSCGESQEEKQKRLSDELMKNVNALQDKLTADTNQLNRDIKVIKATNN